MNFSLPIETRRLQKCFCHVLTCLFWFALAHSIPTYAQDIAVDPGYQVMDTVSPKSAPLQPLPYSHKTHLALGLVCSTCHTNPGSGVLMAFPTTRLCISCHQGDSEDHLALPLLTEHLKANREIPWRRVYQLLPGISWNHRTHISKAIPCLTCHGDVANMNTMYAVKATLAMASCISCHQANSAPTLCVTCHAWPTDSDLGLE